LADDNKLKFVVCLNYLYKGFFIHSWIKPVIRARLMGEQKTTDKNAKKGVVYFCKACFINDFAIAMPERDGGRESF